MFTEPALAPFNPSRSRNDFHQFVESANDAFVSWDAAGTVTEWTSHAEIVFGWSRHEMLGRAFGPSIIAPRHRRVHALRMASFLNHADTPMLGRWFELTALHRGAREIPIEMTAWLVSNDDHHTFNAFVRDLEKRKSIEDALRDRAQLRMVVEAVSDVIILTDLSGVIVYTSPSAQRALGFEPGELEGHILQEFVHFDDLLAFTRTLERATRTPTALVGAQRMRSRDGRHVWMEASAAAVRDTASDAAIGVEITLRDITSRKRADEARKQATSEMTRVIADLREAMSTGNDTVARLHERDRTKDGLVTTASQELRTSLRSISAHATMLSDSTTEPPTARQRGMLEVVQQNTRRLLTMIENLEAIAGVEPEPSLTTRTGR